ncbi:poly polymerase [Aspergillus luchuensis]|uniref:Poly polymerase n=1 Tax=Aspergillus kawachii TaxID=1069201 RepID=A0A146FP04_ASPKA|nr:poly polymerase [Aspergillus luchuensis]
MFLAPQSSPTAKYTVATGTWAVKSTMQARAYGCQWREVWSHALCEYPCKPAVRFAR